MMTDGLPNQFLFNSSEFQPMNWLQKAILPDAWLTTEKKSLSSNLTEFEEIKELLALDLPLIVQKEKKESEKKSNTHSSDSKEKHSKSDESGRDMAIDSDDNTNSELEVSRLMAKDDDESSVENTQTTVSEKSLETKDAVKGKDRREIIKRESLKKNCSHCNTSNTSLWRYNDKAEKVCNACFLYVKKYKKERPVALNNRIFSRRLTRKPSSAKLKTMENNKKNQSHKYLLARRQSEPIAVAPLHNPRYNRIREKLHQRPKSFPAATYCGINKTDALRQIQSLNGLEKTNYHSTSVNSFPSDRSDYLPINLNSGPFLVCPTTSSQSLNPAMANTPLLPPLISSVNKDNNLLSSNLNLNVKARRNTVSAFSTIQNANCSSPHNIDINLLDNNFGRIDNNFDISPRKRRNTEPNLSSLQLSNTQSDNLLLTDTDLYRFENVSLLK
eukprot:Awhi_evm1s2065